MSQTPRPSRFDVERYHVGEADPETTRRVEAHPSTPGRMAELERERAAFAAERPAPADFARDLRARADLARASRRRAWLRWLAPLATAVAVAGILVAVAPSDPQVEVLRVKGDPVDVSVIVLRDGAQRRARGVVRVLPGDRVRISLDVRVDGPLTVGIIDRDGAWVAVADAERFATGHHDLERAFRVDAGPTRARIVAGPPERVARARADGRWEGLATLTLVSGEATP